MKKDKKLNLRFGTITALILLAAFSRIVPHMPNFSPLGAMGLLGVTHFQRKWQSFLIVVAAVWLSDLFINNVIYAKYYSTFTWFYSVFYWIYATYLLIVLAGIVILKKITVMRIIAASLAATTIFFLVTNFICWPGSSPYSHDFSGMMICYAAGIPFLKETFSGDLSYSGILFGGVALAQRQWPALKMKYE